jgi:hypothetical protein
MPLALTRISYSIRKRKQAGMRLLRNTPVVMHRVINAVYVLIVDDGDLQRALFAVLSRYCWFGH